MLRWRLERVVRVLGRDTGARKGFAMRRLLVVAVLLGALAIPLAALGATMQRGAGASCPDGMVGTWEFVNNQTGGAPAGKLHAVFYMTEYGANIDFGPVSPDEATFGRANRNTQKWTLFTNNSARLVSADTTLPGKLVLESFSCAPFAPVDLPH
jgi:hypothetical protein